MRTTTLIALAALLFSSSAAFADDPTLLSCQMQSADNQGMQTMEIRFSQSVQKAEAGGHVVDARISDTQILFDVISDPTVTLHFNIDRLTGRISISGKYQVLMNGECKLADAAKRVF